MNKFIHYLLAATVFLSCLSCKKGEQENNQHDPTNPYEQVEALAKAASGAVEITHYERGISAMTVYLCTPFKYGDSGSSYESISIQESAFSKYENDHEYLTITFKTGTIVKFRYRNALSIDLAPTTEYKDYQGVSREFPFSLLEAGRGKVRFEATAMGKGAASVTFDEKSNAGILTVTLADEEKATLIATLKVTDGTNNKSYAVTAEAYYCSITADNIILVGKKEQEHTIEYSIATNLEEYEIVAELAENSFVSLNGLTVTTLSDNHTRKDRSTTVTLKEKSDKFKAKVITITQEQDEINPDPNSVAFADWNFKNAMLALADLNGDKEITEEEALTVTEISIAGKDVTDLTGLEAFKNVWKFNAQNNDITDATVLKELHQLYWLDLKGNKNLKTFDVTGCTQYFEHCEFEVTADLVYYTFRQQVGVTNYSDPGCQHSKHVIDNRQTTDWSNQDEIVPMKKHTAGKGYPVVFTGISYIDADMNDGSFERQMRKAMELMLANYPYMEEYGKYLDIYCVKHKTANRNQWDLANEEISFQNAKCVETYERFYNQEANLLKKIYKFFYGEEFIEQGMWSILIECTPSGHPGRFQAGFNFGGFNDNYLAEEFGPVFEYCLHTQIGENDETLYGYSSSATLETIFQNKPQSNSYKNFLENIVKN